MPLTLVETLIKYYGMVQTFGNLNSEVEGDSIIDITGPDGAGKTITIKMSLGTGGGSASLEELYRQVGTQKDRDQP